MSLVMGITAAVQAVGADVKALIEDRFALFGPPIVAQKVAEGSAAFVAWMNTAGNPALFSQMLASSTGLSTLSKKPSAVYTMFSSPAARSAIAANVDAVRTLAADSGAMGVIAADAGNLTTLLDVSANVPILANSAVALGAIVTSNPAMSALEFHSSRSTFIASTALPSFAGTLGMLADNAPGVGTVSASSTFGAGYEAWRAFDNDSASRWGAAIAAASGAYLNVTFTQPRVVHTMRITPHAAAVYTAWRLEYSSDGSSWFTARETVSYTASAGVTTTHPINVAGRYRYWRLTFTAAANYASTRELQFDGWL